MNIFILLLAFVIGAVTGARQPTSGNLLTPAGGGQAPNRPISQPGQYPGQNSNQYPGQNTNQNPGQNPNQYPQNPNQYPGQNPNQYPGQNTNQYPGQNPNQYPGQNPNQYPGQNPNQYPGQNSNQYPGQNPGNGQGEQIERCSASPQGRDKTYIVERYNEFFKAQDFIVKNFQYLENPRGELFDACYSHARNQGFPDNDLKDLFCEFGKKVQLLGNDYSINQSKAREWINNLSNDQQQKDIFNNNVQICSDEYTNQNRGNTQSRDCAGQITSMYSCLRRKCDEQNRG